MLCRIGIGDVVCVTYMREYLINGTGKACAWQVRASVDAAALRTPSVTASVVNDGAFEPTGSKKKKHKGNKAM